MPRLKNKKHEKFSQFLAVGYNKAQAYIAAGFKPNRSNASSLSQDPLIINRVKELKDQKFLLENEGDEVAIQNQKVESHDVDKKWVMQQLIGNAKSCMAGNQRSAANRALELIGKELGMFIDRSEVHTTGDLAKLSDEELIKRLQEELEKPESIDPDSITQVIEAESTEIDSPPTDSVH